MPDLQTASCRCGQLDIIAIARGAFDDPYFVVSTISVWETRLHEWVELAGDMEHDE